MNETILVERMFSYRHVRKESSIFLSSSSLSATDAMLEHLKTLHDKCGITINSVDNDILGSVHYFTLLKAENLADKEKLGVLTRTIDYLAASKKDAQRIDSSCIDVDNRNQLYFGPYSGGVISRTLSKQDERLLSSLVTVLMIERSLTRRVLNEAIKWVSAEAPIREIERLLREIAPLNMLLAPNTITNAYEFNSEILPSFLQATSIDKVRDNLENMLKIFQDTLDRQRQRRRNTFLMYVSVIATALGMLQFIRTCLFGRL